MGRLVHSPRAGRENQRENLWMGQQGRFHPEEMVGAWSGREAAVLPGRVPERQPHRQLGRRRALHADDLEGHDARRLRHLSRRRLGLSDLPLFAARQPRRQGRSLVEEHRHALDPHQLGAVERRDRRARRRRPISCPFEQGVDRHMAVIAVGQRHHPAVFAALRAAGRRGRRRRSRPSGPSRRARPRASDRRAPG